MDKQKLEQTLSSIDVFLKKYGAPTEEVEGLKELVKEQVSEEKTVKEESKWKDFFVRLFDTSLRGLGRMLGGVFKIAGSVNVDNLPNVQLVKDSEVVGAMGGIVQALNKVVDNLKVEITKLKYSPPDTYQTKVSNFKDFLKENQNVKVINPEELKVSEVKITNPDDLKQTVVQIEEMAELVKDLKNWRDGLGRMLDEGLSVALKGPTDAKGAIAVRLSDGRDFYRAMTYFGTHVDRLAKSLEEVTIQVAPLIALKNVVGNQINPATEDTLAKLLDLPIGESDSVEFGYTGDDLTTIVFKNGVNTVATLTFVYNLGKLISITKT